jgi:hypothetical protein
MGAGLPGSVRHDAEVPPLRIAHVTPHPVGSGSGIDQYVSHVSRALAARGHEVLVVAPSSDQREVREARAALRSPQELFNGAGEPRVLALGEALPALRPGRRAAVPVDVTRAIEALHAHVPLDICHVHDPFAPSLPSAALRHSRALNVGTFHLPTERIVSGQVARRFVELVFGRLDARTTTFAATAALMQRYFRAEYRLVGPGVEPADAAPRSGEGPVQLAYIEDEERPALRLFLRALRAVDPELDWQVTVLSERGPSTTTPPTCPPPPTGSGRRRTARPPRR